MTETAAPPKSTDLSLPPPPPPPCPPPNRRRPNTKVCNRSKGSQGQVFQAGSFCPERRWPATVPFTERHSRPRNVLYYLSRDSKHRTTSSHPGLCIHLKPTQITCGFQPSKILFCIAIIRLVDILFIERLLSVCSIPTLISSESDE
ncbi:hypothetical protein ACI65C_003066 [Semiaphis heraclei]